jgi:hypothetical protein
MSTLIPPDFAVCQALVPNPRYNPLAFGYNAVMRNRVIPCRNAPTTLVTERRSGTDGQRGSMTLCDTCLAVAQRQLGDEHFFIAARLLRKKDAND